MRRLLIEWKHFDKDGKTCQRCLQTGRNLDKVLKTFQQEGIHIELRETKLPQNRMTQSNSILIDGIPLEDLVPNTKVGENTCRSCSELTGELIDCRCRTVCQGEDIFEEVPVNLIKQAILKKLQLYEINH